MEEAKDACVACGCALGRVRTTVRKPDGTVRFVMCHSCFESQFCRVCVMYFPSISTRQEHRCPN